MDLGKFTEDDAKNAVELFKLISKCAKFEFSMSESLKFSKLMGWYNTLPKRLHEAVIEIKQVVDLEEPTKKSKAKKK